LGGSESNLNKGIADAFQRYATTLNASIIYCPFIDTHCLHTS